MFREITYYDNIKDLTPLPGEIEMDEIMFGGRCPGKCGRGKAGKNIIFGIYQDAVRYLLFLLPYQNTPKPKVSAVLMTGFSMPSYL